MKSGKLARMRNICETYDYIMPTSILCDLSPFMQEFEMANAVGDG